MMRKVIALFDEYQSRENAKHVIRSMKENARQGFWNGSTVPLGYRLVEVERRGTRSRRGSKLTRSRPRTSSSSISSISMVMELLEPLGSRRLSNGLTAKAIGPAAAKPSSFPPCTKF